MLKSLITDFRIIAVTGENNEACDRRQIIIEFSHSPPRGSRTEAQRSGECLRRLQTVFDDIVCVGTDDPLDNEGKRYCRSESFSLSLKSLRMLAADQLQDINIP